MNLLKMNAYKFRCNVGFSWSILAKILIRERQIFHWFFIIINVRREINWAKIKIEINYINLGAKFSLFDGSYNLLLFS